MDPFLPSPLIRQRLEEPAIIEHFQRQGLDRVIARILASRFPPEGQWDALLNPKLQHLSQPSQLIDIQKAAMRIVQALANHEIIALETDHDCDGQTAHAVLFTALVRHFKHPENKVLSFIGHRLEEGYGLSEALMQRILNHTPRPTLVITADNGSSDEARIQVLAQEGIDVIVSDHHEIPSSGIPKSAFAVINPSRPDCAYPDKSIAGCMVAWLLMAQVRAQLIATGALPSDSPSLAALLDFVAVGTVADCVSLADSVNNRAVVRYGIQAIAKGLRPCWRAIQPLLRGPLSSEDLGFIIGPLLNSDGRLSDALTSVSFLLAKTHEEAIEWVHHLSAQNEKRKAIQKTITQAAMMKASALVKEGARSICLLLEEGHSGVHGISASRLKDAFGRPTILFSPKRGHPNQITGSARSIDGFHIRQAFEMVAARMPQGILSFGGHKGAAGITLDRSYFSEFQQIFEAVVASELKKEEVGPVIWSDGVLPPDYWNIPFLEKLEALLHPFGRAFDPPTFEAIVEIRNIQMVGDGSHAKLVVGLENGTEQSAIWFQARWHAEAPLPIDVGDKVHLAFRLSINTFRGTQKVDLQVVGCTPVCVPMDLASV